MIVCDCVIKEENGKMVIYPCIEHAEQIAEFVEKCGGE